MRGDGAVELEDLATPPRAETQRRSIADTEVVALVNEFLKARFFDALDVYDERNSWSERGTSCSCDAEEAPGRGWMSPCGWGRATKTVRLKENVPADLEI